MRSLVPSKINLTSPGSSDGSRGGINVSDEEFEKKVTDILTPILEAKDKALEEANDKIGQMEGLLYDVRRDLGPVTVTFIARPFSCTFEKVADDTFLSNIGHFIALLIQHLTISNGTPFSVTYLNVLL